MSELEYIFYIDLDWINHLQKPLTKNLENFHRKIVFLTKIHLQKSQREL